MNRFFATIAALVLMFTVGCEPDNGDQDPTIDYYISFSTGNDSNDGLTESTAWQTLSKLNAEKEKFTAGKIIALKAGDKWNESLRMSGVSGDANNPVAFTSYGAGDAPIIEDLQEYNDTYTHLGGNIWEGSHLESYMWEGLEISFNFPRRMKIDGVEVLRAYDESDLGTAIPDLTTFWYGDAGNGNGKRLYIYSTTDPANKRIEFSSTAFAVEITGFSNVTFKNLNIKGGYGASLLIAESTNLVFENLIIGEMGQNGVTITNYEGQLGNTNIIFDACIIDAKYTLDFSEAGIYPGSTTLGANDGFRIVDVNSGEIKNSTVKNWGHASLNLYANGFEGNPIQGLKIYNNTFTAPNRDYGGRMALDGNTHDNEIYDNIIIDTIVSQINGYSNHLHHNIFKDIKSSILKNGENGYGISFQNYASESRDNIVENNVFIDNESGGIEFVGNGSAGDSYGHIVRNNIIYNCGAGNNNYGIEFVIAPEAPNHGNTIINNVIYSSASSNTISYYGTPMAVADFNAQTSSDHTISDNISGNPLFVNDASDWRLQDLSPAINAGVSGVSTTDYYGNMVPHPATETDIGIHETIDE